MALVEISDHDRRQCPAADDLFERREVAAEALGDGYRSAQIGLPRRSLLGSAARNILAARLST